MVVLQLRGGGGHQLNGTRLPERKQKGFKNHVFRFFHRSARQPTSRSANRPTTTDRHVNLFPSRPAHTRTSAQLPTRSILEGELYNSLDSLLVSSLKTVINIS